MKLTRTLAPILAVGLFSTAALAQGAHTHGHAEIEIALEKGKAFVKVEIPAEDAVGFEKEPQTAAQKAAVEKALALLGQADKVFAFDAAAGCTFANTEVEFENEGGSHFAFHAEYTGVCATPSKLRTLEIRAFDLFPSLEEFEAELLTAKGVHEMEIEKDEPRANIARAM